MNDPSQDGEKKIIIDEDWKSQVEREREELKAEPEADADPAVNPDEATGLPPASFLLLATTLATQAMAGLGQLPDPIENKPIVNLQLAQHYIDMLSVLEEKTKGNLTDEEQEMLGSVLYQLRSVYIAVDRDANKPDEA
ncbi:MAG: hypothetical protein CMJ77_24645 [Planctomycetaceae bacterium]|nr:hypothetical protein [Planctomycetaceae bacterium]